MTDEVREITDEERESLASAFLEALEQWSDENDFEPRSCDVCGAFGFLMTAMLTHRTDPEVHINIAEWFAGRVIEDARMRRPN